MSLTKATSTVISGVGASAGSASVPSVSFADDSNTGIYNPSADTLGFVTGGNERFRIESTGQIKAVYESTVGTKYNTTLDNGYFCRAWVNFDGTGTVAIRASGNVSSITDGGTGTYTINFTVSMPDASYCGVACDNSWGLGYLDSYTINSVRTGRYNASTLTNIDLGTITVVVFR